MAVQQVVGELLADGDVGGDAAVEEVVRERTDYRRHGGPDEGQVVQEIAAELQVDAGTPGEGICRKEQYCQEHQWEEHHDSGSLVKANRKVKEFAVVEESGRTELIASLRMYIEDLRESGVDGLPFAPQDLPKSAEHFHAKATASAPVEYHPVPAALVAPSAAPDEDLPAIRASLGDCRRCALGEKRTNLVFGVGNPSARLMFVGEAPGRDEDLKGEPFVGEAGQLLTRIVGAMGLTRNDVYICNVLKCRPPENRNPLPHEIETCSPYLRRQLDAIQPRIICCLGKFAAELLVGVKGTIGGLRGRVYRYQGSKLIVTYHPAACLRNPGYKRPVWEDMQLLAREYRAG
jgi:DNA polymerase